MISRIILFPKELYHDRVLAFLEVQDLVGFDSALLNHRLRPQMLDQLKGAHLNTDSVKVDPVAAKWFLQRNICMSGLRLSRATKDFSKLKQLASSVDTLLVNFDDCEMLTAATINDVLESCRMVKCLSFRMIYQSKMEGSILETVAENCKDLQRIDFSYSRCCLQDQLIPLFASCKSLTDLSISYCGSWVNDECINIIAANCPPLRSFQADHCYQCEDSALMRLGQYCHNLRHLSLRLWPAVTDEGAAALTACRELRTLLLDDSTHITSQGIINLAQSCTKLEEIGVPRCDNQIDTAIAALVQHCPALKVMRCRSIFFTDKTLQSLQNCPHLHTLELKQADKIKFTALLQLLDHCPALRRLELPLISFHCADATAYSAIVFTAEHFSLEYIDFSKFDSLTDAAFITLISKCHNIVHLNLYMCTELTDASIIAVASHCRKLEVLNTSYVTSVSDAAVCAIANNCPYLRYLNMSRCTKLTDAGIVAILQKCRKLRELLLSGCKSISGTQVMDAVMQYGSRIRTLNIGMCAKTDYITVTALRKAMPNCNLIAC